MVIIIRTPFIIHKNRSTYVHTIHIGVCILIVIFLLISLTYACTCQTEIYAIEEAYLVIQKILTYDYICDCQAKTSLALTSNSITLTVHNNF